MMVAHTYNTSLVRGRLRQEDCSKLKASLDYILVLGQPDL